MYLRTNIDFHLQSTIIAASYNLILLEAVLLTVDKNSPKTNTTFYYYYYYYYRTFLNFNISAGPAKLD